MFTPAAGFFGTGDIEYTIQDARGTTPGQATGLLTVNVIGRPSPPSTPRRPADNATATRDVGLGRQQRQPDRRRRDRRSIRGSRGVVGLTNSSHVRRAGQRCRPPVPGAGRSTRPAGAPWGPFSAPVTPDTEPGPAGGADGPVRRRAALIVTWTPPANEGTAITGYELEMGGGRRAGVGVGIDDVHVAGADERRELPVPASSPSTPPGRRRPRRGRPPSTPARAGHARRAGADPGRQPDRPVVGAGDRNGDPIIGYQVRDALAGTGEIRARRPAPASRGANLPNGVAQQFRVRALNRDPDLERVERLSAPMKPCGVPDRSRRATAVRGDGSGQRHAGPAPRRAGLRDQRLHGVASNGMRRAPASTDRHSPAHQRHRPTVPVCATNSVGNGACSARPTRSSRPARRSGPASITADRVRRRCRSPSAGPPPTTTAPRSPTTRWSSTTAEPRRRAGHVVQLRRRPRHGSDLHVQGAGLQRRRLRRVDRRPLGHDVGRSPSQVGTAERRRRRRHARRRAGVGTERPTASAIDELRRVELDPGGVESPSHRPLARRGTTSPTAPPTGSCPGLQRRRLRRVERVGVGHAPLAGQHHGQLGRQRRRPARLQPLVLRVAYGSSPPASARTPPTPSRAAATPATPFSATQCHDRRQRPAHRRPGLLLRLPRTTSG